MKTLNMTHEELVTLVGLVRDGMMYRQLQNRGNAGNTPEERFILDYAQTQAGYTASWSQKLLQRMGLAD